MIGQDSEPTPLDKLWTREYIRRHRKPRHIWLAAALVVGWAGLVLTISCVLAALN